MIPLRREASANLLREPKLEICASTTGALWLINKGTENITLDAGELFGFNVGSFVEVSAGLRRFVRLNRCFKGTASTCNTSLPWLVPDDKVLVSLVCQEKGGETKKTIMSIGEVMCWVTKKRGVTEVYLHQHDMRPQMKVGTPQCGLL